MRARVRGEYAGGREVKCKPVHLRSSGDEDGDSMDR